MFDTFIDFVTGTLPLTEPEIALIRQFAVDRSVREGEYLVRSGTTARELFFIASGVLSIVVPMPDGLDATGYFIAENRFCTLLDSFHRQVPAPEGIRAACASSLLVFRHSDLMSLFGALPSFERFVAESSQRTLMEKIQVKNSYFGLDAAARYQRFLSLQPNIASRVALGDIAAYLEVTPQSLSRIRRQMH
ncbi:MAG TPA: cyclic nucleotide-binding domain-containing protein [Dinghuibacter sp.]|jgi:CRP-like cAMP-binding protein|uniref:Crp/Fnr family transcriptional regulator n=1 Tax=Dinghuibacter sp. TaxID=2024697 RepID=UPI002CD77BA0|nr:cyclic nucleotide-binding domain-containing protein [Dinghuibacter sp.]HTJ14105.1 cyclic nucleotide-binding domain-containing protein [Dinghuibacter sp.]